MKPLLDEFLSVLRIPERVARIAPIADAARIPADERRHPPGCPDADFCRSNRLCWWDCQGRQSDDQEQG